MNWIVYFDSDSLKELEEGMSRGYIIKLSDEGDDGYEHAYIEKALFSRLGALQMHIYAGEHPPPHFHVKYQGQENSFRIDDASPLYPNGELKKWFKNIKKWHNENKQELINTWNQSRPFDCPVGSIF